MAPADHAANGGGGGGWPGPDVAAQLRTRQRPWGMQCPLRCGMSVHARGSDGKAVQTQRVCALSGSGVDAPCCHLLQTPYCPNGKCECRDGSFNFPGNSATQGDQRPECRNQYYLSCKAFFELKNGNPQVSPVSRLAWRGVLPRRFSCPVKWRGLRPTHGLCQTRCLALTRKGRGSYTVKYMTAQAAHACCALAGVQRQVPGVADVQLHADVQQEQHLHLPLRAENACHPLSSSTAGPPELATAVATALCIETSAANTYTGTSGWKHSS